MRQFGMLCTLALLLFVIAPSRGYSQDRDENKPRAQQAQPQDQSRPQDDRAKDNGARQDQNRQDQARPNERPQQDEARPNDNNRQADEQRRQEDQNARHDQRDNDRNRPQANRPEDQQRDQRPADNRGDRDMDRDNHRPAANRGRRIPDDQFRSHFGREHHFHVQRNEIVNVQQPVIVYGGYSWELAEPWPSDWSYDDDCYIDEVDGEYFLFDVLHPEMRIAIFIVG